MQDKSKIIEKIVTSPQELTEEDILLLSDDDELRELYQCAVIMSSAATDVPIFDTDKSISQLHGQMIRPKRPMGMVKRLVASVSRMRAAAIVAVCLSLSAIAVLAFMYFTAPHSGNSVPTNVELVADTEPASSPEAETKVEKLYFDDTQLSQILDAVSAIYHCEVRYANDQAREYRYHITIPSNASLEEVVEMINAFDEVKITLNDNVLTVE